MGRYREAQTHLAESLAIAREIQDTRMTARVLQPLGMAALGQGDVSAARDYLQEALELARNLGDKRELAGALNALAQLHRIQGDLETAEPLYQQVVTLARELGDREIIAVGLLNLAMASLGRGANDRARAILLEALSIAEEIGSRPAAQSVVEVCAGLAALRQEWDWSARFYGVAEAQISDTGIQRDPTDEAFLRPLVAKSRAALGTAEFAAAEHAGRAVSYGDAIAEARAWLEDAGPSC
jgi:tetratricopeptide (TPR) repeat protein